MLGRSFAGIEIPKEEGANPFSLLLPYFLVPVEMLLIFA